MDEDGSGSITIDELEEPLIGLGLAENRFEVEKMIAKADVDASGYIDFDEFLMILKIGDKNDVMSKFFKDMVNGDLPGLSSYGDMPFRLMVSTFRRKQMMSAMFSADPNEK